MSNELQLQQPTSFAVSPSILMRQYAHFEDDPGVPPVEAAPPATTDWKAEYDKVVRQYNGAQGVIKSRTQERDKFKTDLDLLSTDFEGFKQESSTTASTLNQTKTQLEQIQTTHNSTAAELAAIKLTAAEFPDLVRYVAKGMIQPGNLQGDDLRKFLTDWKTEFESIGAEAGRNRSAGTTPPAPASNPQGAMTFEEVVDAKMDALRNLGANSKEFKQYSVMEQQMIQQGKFTTGSEYAQIGAVPSRK